MDSFAAVYWENIDFVKHIAQYLQSVLDLEVNVGTVVDSTQEKLIGLPISDVCIQVFLNFWISYVSKHSQFERDVYQKI